MSTPPNTNDFTVNRNLLLINSYIRHNEFVTNVNISNEIVLLINKFYMNQIFEQFDDIILLEGIVKSLKSNDINTLNTVSKDCLLSILNRDNVITRAKPFSYNKLSTISIAALQMVDIDINDCQVLIISPSREKAQALYKNTASIGKYLNNLHNEICIGGTTVTQDIQQMISSNGNCKHHIINGVVERIYCMIKQNAFNTNKLKLFVLDDANNLFDKGFREKIEKIINYLPNKTQIAIFSSDQTVEFESKHMTNAVHINVDSNHQDNDEKNNIALSLTNIKHYYVRENEQHCLETLCDILDCLLATRCIIYCNTKQKVIWLNEKLSSNDFHVTTSFDKFVNGDGSILISMDDCHKNNDIYNNNMNALIINYDLAVNGESFLFRNGSYNSKHGISVHFVCENQMNDMINLEKKYHLSKMDELPINIESILK